jgi:hypothetical protein
VMGVCLSMIEQQLYEYKRWKEARNEG